MISVSGRATWVATWLRDEDGEPVYRIIQRGIKAASSAGVIARKLLGKRAI